MFHYDNFFKRQYKNQTSGMTKISRGGICQNVSARGGGYFGFSAQGEGYIPPWKNGKFGFQRYLGLNIAKSS